MDTHEIGVVRQAVEEMAAAAEKLNQQMQELARICDEAADKLLAASLVGAKHEG